MERCYTTEEALSMIVEPDPELMEHDSVTSDSDIDTTDEGYLSWAGSGDPTTDSANPTDTSTTTPGCMPITRVMKQCALCPTWREVFCKTWKTCLRGAFQHQWRTMSLDHNQQGGRAKENADVTLNYSERFRRQCDKLLFETDKTCKRLQDDYNYRFAQQSRDVEFLKSELNLKLEGIIQEIDALVSLQSRVKMALEATKEPLRVTILCVEERMNGLPLERLHDRVDTELGKEREVVKGVAAVLQRVVEQIIEQIRRNRSAQYHLENDLKDKSEAQCIDHSCAIMTTTSVNLEPQFNDPSLPSSTVTLKQWKNISHNNIAKAEQQKINSKSLRDLVESVLEQTAADMQKQMQATKAAFQMNIQEIKSAKAQLESKVAKVVSEISDQMRIREELHTAITENEQLLSLAQARLSLSRQRPGNDLVHTQLLEEVQQLIAHINTLRQKVSHSEEEQRKLTSDQLKLQENIDMKATYLYIDDVICTQHREPIVIRTI